MKDLWIENGIKDLVQNFKISKKRLILLDFDGTLIDFVINPSDALPSQELSDLLSKIAVQPNNKLVIITGRRKNDIEHRIGNLPVDIVAEHGAMIKENSTWKILIDGLADWKKEVTPVVTKFTCLTPYTVMEEKNYSIAWNYRNIDTDTGKVQSRTLIELLTEIALKYNLKIIDGNKIVEIIDKRIHKGFATNYLINKENYDYILSMGDDKTDEDMFDELRHDERAYTVKIGEGSSLAKYKLHNVQQVSILLNQLLIEPLT